MNNSLSWGSENYVQEIHTALDVPVGLAGVGGDGLLHWIGRIWHRFWFSGPDVERTYEFHYRDGGTRIACELAGGDIRDCVRVQRYYSYLCQC